MPVEYRGFEGVTKFFYLACTKIQGVQVSIFRLNSFQLDFLRTKAEKIAPFEGKERPPGFFVFF